MRWMRTLIAYAMPGYLAVLLAIIVQGAVAPWPPAREALAAHAGQVPVMVGIATRVERGARGIETTQSRYYVLLPGALRDPHLLRVTRSGDGPVETGTSRAGFWMLLAALLVSIVGTWWFWFGARRTSDDATPD